MIPQEIANERIEDHVIYIVHWGRLLQYLLTAFEFLLHYKHELRMIWGGLSGMAGNEQSEEKEVMKIS